MSEVQHEVVVTMRITLRFPRETKRPVVEASDQMDQLFTCLREINPSASWSFAFAGEIIPMPRVD